MDKKTFAIILFLCLLVFLLYFKQVPLNKENLNNSKFDSTQSVINYLKENNNKLSDSLYLTEKTSKILKQKNDSLDVLREIVETNYKVKYEKFKTIFAYPMSMEFARIFSENNIK